jgi:hypothetical protein
VWLERKKSVAGAPEVIYTYQWVSLGISSNTVPCLSHREEPGAWSTPGYSTPSAMFSWRLSRSRCGCPRVCMGTASGGHENRYFAAVDLVGERP